VTLGAAVVAATFLSVLGGSWWLLGVTVLVLLAVAFFVVRTVLSLLADVDAPSPTERARLEAHGVRDPERRLNERQARRRGSPVRRLLSEDSGDASSTEQQQSAWTPAPSRRAEAE
jgi:hypothetical protein